MEAIIRLPRIENTGSANYGPTSAWTDVASLPIRDARSTSGATHPAGPHENGFSQVNWYALYTYPRHEKRVNEQIKQRHISCFLPLYRSVRRWKDRRKELELPLFPGYVFVYIALRDRLAVLQLAGAVRFVSFNGHPTPVPEKDIASIMNGLSNGFRLEPHPYLTVGRRVRVRYGPLAGAQGVLVRRKDRFRVVLSLDLIMRSVSVEVDESDIEPC